MDTTLEITTDGKNLIISPIKNEKRSKNFKSALAKINKRHDATLRRLAQ